jgi:hypothetical protein
MFNLLSQNAKIKKTGKKNKKQVFNFNLPAIITCPNAGECKKICYAKRGNYGFPNVKNKQLRNLAQTLSPTFSSLMIAEILKNKADVIRIHDSGDFGLNGHPRRDYFEAWLSIATVLPNVTFYAYTKCVSMSKEYLLPDNFIVIYSYGGTEDHLIDPAKDKYSMVFKNDYQRRKAGYIKANNNDLKVFENNKIGLIKH